MYSNTIGNNIRISGGKDPYSIFKEVEVKKNEVKKENNNKTVNDVLIRNNCKNNNMDSQDNDFIVERGCIYYADLGETRGSIQGFERPFLVTSNWKCNKNSPVIMGIPLTSQLHKKNLPVHVMISKDGGLDYDSIALAEQTMPLNKFDLISYVGRCSKEEMKEIEKAIQIQNGIDCISQNENLKTNNNYSTEQKQEQNEVFDISKAKSYASQIEELDNFIKTFDNPMVNPVKRGRDTIFGELKKYCSDFNENINLFYKVITNNTNNNNYNRGNVVSV